MVRDDTHVRKLGVSLLGVHLHDQPCQSARRGHSLAEKEPFGILRGGMVGRTFKIETAKKTLTVSTFWTETGSLEQYIVRESE